jgi:hypothetical protein
MQGPAMFKFLSPTLLSLALVIGVAGMSPAWSATAEERDQHALAVSKLMMAGMLHPANRQMKSYKQAGYPANDPYLDKVLRHMYLDRFANDLPEADKEKNDVELKALSKELEPALKGNKLSVTAKLIFSGGGGSSTRMVNEIARIMHPESAPPLVKPAPDKLVMLTRMIEALGKQAEEDFIAAVQVVNANKAAEAKIWDLAEASKEYQAAVNVAIDLRLEALRPFVVSMIALRDAANRGDKFGIDPAPIKAQLAQMFSKVRPEADKKTWAELLSNWDFEWGEFNPYIRINCGTLLADAGIVGAKGAKEEEIEGVLQAVIDFSVKDFQTPSLRQEAYKLKLMGWHALLNYRLAQNTPKSLNRGAALWKEFLERAKTDDYLTLNKTPLAGDLGRVYMLVARLFHAKGDLNSANGLLAEVVGAKPQNPYAHYAKGWIAYLGSGGGLGVGGRNAWANQPLAEHPEKALLIAKAFMSEANATADPAQMRGNLLSAATSLRNGVLGLAAPTMDEKIYVELAPQVYQLYAVTMYKLDMRYQAVVVSQEGARALANKIKWYAENKKPNPWMKKDPKDSKKLIWDDSRVTPLRVANDGMIFANQLTTRNRNAQSLLNDSIELLRTIDPEAVGENLRKQQVLAKIQENDFEGAVREAQAFTKEYPESYLWTFSAVSSARTMLMDKLIKEDNKARVTQLIKEIEDDNKVVAGRIAEELKKSDLAPEKRKELERARSTIKVAEVESLIAKQMYEEVIKLLDADFMRNLPSDDQLAARMVRQLSRATHDWHDSRKDLLAKDPAALLEALKTYEIVYQNLERGMSKLRNKNVDSTLDGAAKLLAIVFNRSVSMIVRLQGAGNASAELLEMATTANRAFADLYEPTLTDSTPLPNLLFIASTLWDVEEKERAAKQYIRYLSLLGKDQNLSEFKQNPLPMIEKYSAVVTARGEFKKSWEEIVDLAYDSAEDRQAYKDLPQANWPKRQRKDLIGAITKIKEFRQLMAKNKAVVAPAQYKQIEEAVDGLSDLLNTEANKIMAESRLAVFYRENDQFDKALPILMDHYNDDPLSLDNQMALVLVTYNAALKADPMPPKAELEKARGVAANIRAEKRGTRDKTGYWEAYTLVLEFSVMMGETKVVNDSLSFLRRDRSDISRDLVAPSVYGDDKRLRRPQNALSTQLARRFLGLYEKNGVTEKPSFKMVEVDVNGTPIIIFTDPDAPTFETKTMLTPDEDEVTALVATDGSTPAPKPPTAAEPPPKAEEKPAEVTAPKTEEKPAETTAPKADEKPAEEKKGEQ